MNPRSTGVHLPREVCSNVSEALRREWLVTNGIGGFACGTVAGALTRRYHGLLIAALRPPLGRTLLVSKIDEAVTVGDQTVSLATNVWKTGVAEPAGCRLLHGFDVTLGVPAWHFVRGGCRIIKRVWMERGRNTTYVRYEHAEGRAEVVLTCKFLVNCRDYHSLARVDPREWSVCEEAGGLRAQAPGAAASIRIQCDRNDQSRWNAEKIAYRDYALEAERERGLDYLEDHLWAGTCRVGLRPGASITFALSADRDAPTLLDGAAALERHIQAARGRLEMWESRAGGRLDAAPPEIAQLVLAADSFVVARARGAESGHTIIAGYPWFTDWGRDTMIALPGLTICTGRFDVAREILRTWSRYVDGGMIPNRFPDDGATPDYNAADAGLWYLWAIDQYVRATNDLETLRDLFPTVCAIVDATRRGTRHNIRVHSDGLVYAGEPGVNLTWMDARIGERVVTPRTGKPVELSALWYDALRNAARHADRLGLPAEEFKRQAEQTQAGFARFWNPRRGCCHDVLDGPDGDDSALRPNQIFAVSLAHSPLTSSQQRRVLASCAKELWTPFGLRSLAPGEPGYCGVYRGDPVARDEAYHQGTVWGWLLGPFVLAEFRVHRDRSRARELLLPMLRQLREHGIGTLSEIFDADAPHTPRGCIAQAWTVGEILRAWQLTQRRE